LVSENDPLNAPLNTTLLSVVNVEFAVNDAAPLKVNPPESVTFPNVADEPNETLFDTVLPAAESLETVVPDPTSNDPLPNARSFPILTLPAFTATPPEKPFPPLNVNVPDPDFAIPKEPVTDPDNTTSLAVLNDNAEEMVPEPLKVNTPVFTESPITTDPPNE
jgi:hypothetical protein